MFHLHSALICSFNYCYLDSPFLKKSAETRGRGSDRGGVLSLRREGREGKKERKKDWRVLGSWNGKVHSADAISPNCSSSDG